MRKNGYLLYILGPFWGITQGHESTVGQDGEHDQHAEHRRDEVKEHNGTFVFLSIIFCTHTCMMYDTLAHFPMHKCDSMYTCFHSLSSSKA